MARALECPLQGERFKPEGQIYVPKWLRDKLWRELPRIHSPQYCKAWNATFPPDLWLAKEEVVEEKLVLRLKDGTTLPAYGSVFGADILTEEVGTEN